MITDGFIPGSGLVYRLDPRPKLVLLIVITVLYFSGENIALYAGFLVLTLILTAVTLGPGNLLRPIRMIWPILLLTALLTPPFSPGGKVLLTAGERVLLTQNGLEAAVVLILRFFGITTAFFLFFSTTETSSFILALRAFGLPFRAAMTVTISLRYIPDMFRVYQNITDAHKLRRAGIKSVGRKRGFAGRVERLFPVLISVLIYAVKNIPGLAMALDSKGFGRAGRRTSCKKLPPWHAVTKDIVAAAFTAAALVILRIII